MLLIILIQKLQTPSRFLLTALKIIIIRTANKNVDVGKTFQEFGAKEAIA